MTQIVLSRRHMMVGATSLAALALTGCATTQSRPKIAEHAPIAPQYLSMYGPVPDEKFPIPAARIDLLDAKFYRQMVANPTGERPGTVVVDTRNRFLYWTMDDGQAMRYGVGIGREGFAWGGRAKIAYKRKWPTWTPPSEMIDRQPELEIYRQGMEPGLENPLGARALYIFQDGKDTLYRLHGNMDVNSIGKAVSSGCVRLLFQDVIDLYQRVPDGSPILVVQ
ncbi:L,D-transpeptidase [Devosia rhodophyticola]|uniref:L,D-transpeptidase n=1 Tax=Devosia rhodophyticola TaxID=3026423 RepID=A0ABY7YYA2_9HYPH|nr:L,D-transpeptidase [Devosia rhodophyticola]WDR06073.1 L,D-transpeptidase [Devosia rhodophyticola]